jgi:hypothetical protein
MAFTYSGEMADLGGGRGWLDRAPAESVFRIDQQLGHLLQITDAGRTWDQQDREYQTYLRVGYPIALNPDTPSIHQRGGAIDSNEAQQILAIMADHGWIRTVYRWVNGLWTLVEEWHFEYFLERDNHRTETAAPAAVTSEEDDEVIRIQSPNRGIALIGPGYYRQLANDEEVNNSGAIITKHVSGNDRQFDLWVSMAVGGQGAGISGLMTAIRQEARPLKLYTNKGKLVVEGPGGKSWEVPQGYRELLEALGLVGPNVIRDLPDNEREFLDFILGLLGPAHTDPKA